MRAKAKKAESLFRGEGKPEEATRIKNLLQEYKDQLEEFGEPLSMEGWIDYFTGTRETVPGLF